MTDAKRALLGNLEVEISSNHQHHGIGANIVEHSLPLQRSGELNNICNIEIDTSSEIQTCGPPADVVNGKTCCGINTHNTHIKNIVSIATDVERATFMEKRRNRGLDAPIAIETIAGNSTNAQHRISRIGIDSQTRAQIPTTRLLSRSCYGTHGRHNQQKQFFHLSYYFMDRGFSYRVA